MLRFLVLVLGLGVFAFGGWVAGSVYPAPAEVIRVVGPQALEARAAAGLQSIDWSALRRLLTPEQLEAFTASAVEESAAAGQVIVVERVEPEIIQEAAPEGVPSALAAPASASFEQTLSLCPGMTVSNAPRVDGARQVVNFKPIVAVRGKAVATYPTRGACLASAFGPRGARTHKGLDFHAREGGPILAAGDGVIREKKYRDDYGNMVLIDHGDGVFTRYAHLSSFQRGLTIGATVKAGDQIGLMGNTASYALPVHLHYEVLVGDYDTPKASFGLEAIDPLTLPAAT